MLPFGFVLRRPDVKTKTDEPSHTRIRCPMCGWEPSKSDHWSCEPGCGHVWNTFETRGRCPGCDKKWFLTACLRCSQWSPHENWYDRAAG